MKLHLQSDCGATIISNDFIDRYMPAANGEFVKLYLYLLRCAGTGRELSVSSIADFFDHTEKDVQRALLYWEKQGILQLRYDGNNAISDILFCIESGTKAPDVSAQEPAADPAGLLPETLLETPSPEETGPDAGADSGTMAEEAAVPDKKSLSPARKKALKQQDDIRQLIFVAQSYMGRPLTSTEVNNLLYFYESLHFSVDLIEYLTEYCASKGNPGARYMEKVALGWYKEGITTVAEARQSAALFQKEYYQIFDALGIRGRSPAPSEVEYMDRWLHVYGFDLSLIREACARTILKTHQPSLSYVESILKSWQAGNVKTLEDIHKMDADHQQKKAVPAARPAAGARASSRVISSNRFNNFPQREYDWSALEKELLQVPTAKEE